MRAKDIRRNVLIKIEVKERELIFSSRFEYETWSCAKIAFGNAKREKNKIKQIIPGQNFLTYLS